MTASEFALPKLCGISGCRRLEGHGGSHNKYPTEAWAFFSDKDQKKIDKAGYATPRGGRKGAYQNHVYRNNRVIIPFERVDQVDFQKYVDSYVIRLLPEQYFSARHQVKEYFLDPECPVRVGENAFVLYRSHESFEQYPPLPNWRPRYLLKSGVEVLRRDEGAEDHGHYVLRLPTVGARREEIVGPPQGIFAPEYADAETNFLSQSVLAWLIIQTSGSPYTLNQAPHLRSILRSAGLDDVRTYETKGVLRHGLSCCPLCTNIIRYSELHKTVSFEEMVGLGNAAIQVEGATRSTVVNLFHLEPLVYSKLTHTPQNVAWGHAVCNTRLGQRKCYSLDDLQQMGLKVGVILEEGIETFGWISEDFEMIRSPKGAVWIRLHSDLAEDLDQNISENPIGENGV